MNKYEGTVFSMKKTLERREELTWSSSFIWLEMVMWWEYFQKSSKVMFQISVSIGGVFYSH